MLLNNSAIGASLQEAWGSLAAMAAESWPTTARPTPAWPPGPGITAALIRTRDWSSTPLGPSSQWPVWLRTSVSALLDSPLPSVLVLGTELLQIHNDAALPLLDAGRSGAIGDRWDARTPEGRLLDETVMYRVMQTGTSVHVKDQMHGTDAGTQAPQYFDVAYVPARDEQGEVRGVSVVALETTARVALERENAALLQRARFDAEQLRQIFHRAPGFMAWLDGPQHTFELANPAYQRLVGERSVIGRSARDAFPATAERPMLDILDQVFRSGEAIVVAGMQLILHNGPVGNPETRYLDAVYQPVLGADGAVSGVFVQGHDVTGQTLTAQSLARTAAQKDEFLATLAHELRNPLAPIVNVATLLGRLPDPDHRLASLGQILQRQTAHMTRLIDDLLDTSRMGRGMLQLQTSPLDMRIVLAAAVEQVSPAMKRCGHALEIRLAPSPLLVDGDSARLVQVFANLLNNAAKFTPHGGKVALDASLSDAGLQVQVRDNGAGIDAAFLPLMFEPFQQGQRLAARQDNGLGLGLALVRSLVELHGGSVSAASAGPGQGSAFTVRLPLHAAA